MYINDSLIEQLFITKIQSLEILLRIKQRKKKEERRNLYPKSRYDIGMRMMCWHIRIFAIELIVYRILYKENGRLPYFLFLFL